VLDLSWNGFEDDGARALCDSMRVNNTLTELNIRNNRISTVGAAHIARGLEGNNTLEVLKVRLAPFTVACLVPLFSHAPRF
jgi:Ran GTPase-activating protein (RanGAP) involved in mRNA processing and transport